MEELTEASEDLRLLGGRHFGWLDGFLCGNRNSLSDSRCDSLKYERCRSSLEVEVKVWVRKAEEISREQGSYNGGQHNHQHLEWGCFGGAPCTALLALLALHLHVSLTWSLVGLSMQPVIHFYILLAECALSSSLCMETVQT